MLRLSEKFRFQTSCLAADGMRFTRPLSYEGLASVLRLAVSTAARPVSENGPLPGPLIPKQALRAPY
jgi:hypothetical protein